MCSRNCLRQMCLSEDEEIRYYAQKRDEALKFETIALTAAEKKGRKEGRKEGRQEGRKEGRQEGAIIGEIRLAQRFLEQPVDSVDELSEKSLAELHRMFQSLETQLHVRR